MSLRTFHLLFILAAIILADMFGAWAFREYATTHEATLLWMGVPSLLAGLGLCAYAILFVRRMDEEHVV